MNKSDIHTRQLAVQPLQQAAGLVNAVTAPGNTRRPSTKCISSSLLSFSVLTRLSCHILGLFAHQVDLDTWRSAPAAHGWRSAVQRGAPVSEARSPPSMGLLVIALRSLWHTEHRGAGAAPAQHRRRRITAVERRVVLRGGTEPGRLTKGRPAGPLPQQHACTCAG